MTIEILQSTLSDGPSQISGQIDEKVLSGRTLPAYSLMRHYPSCILSCFSSFELFERIRGFVRVQVFECANAIFVFQIFVDPGHVVRGGMKIGVIDEGKGLIDVLQHKLIVLSNGTFLTISCEEEQDKKQSPMHYDLSYISTEFPIHINSQRLVAIKLTMEIIFDYQFDLSEPVLLLHPNNKFWEVTISGVSVTFKVGKLKNGEQSAEEKVEKDYPSPAAARASIVQKIKDKLTKGYVSKTAKLRDIPQEEQKPVIRQIDKRFKSFSGEYYQKNDGKESVKVEVNGSRVKITRQTEGKSEDIEYREFKTSDDAIIECMKEEEMLKRDGYKAMSHKFIYSFVDEGKVEKGNNYKSEGTKGTNVLSITAMTDDAMSHRSRNTSSAKSDRSFYSGDEGERKLSDTKTELGPPSSTCIKVLLAEKYQEALDPTGWIMSEKLDGVRCFWTGSVMFSRNGNRFFPPKFFTQNWPNSQLDGELFIGRGRFSQTISAVKKGSPIDDEWKKVRYLVFDCPGLKKPFKTRIKAMQKVLSEIDNSYIKCHAHRECKGFSDLFDELQKVNKTEGEGLMLRDPESFYENRRSTSLLKVKTFYDDEAEVIGYTAGTGRCTGMVGSLKVRNGKGIQFEVGSGLTDDLRRRPPKIGTKITYKYQEFNKESGKPRFPTFMRTYDFI